MSENKITAIPLTIHYCDYWTLPDWNHRNLSAPYWRVYWNDRPGWHVDWNGEKTSLDPEHLVIVTPDTPFSGHSKSVSSHLFVHFTAGGPYGAVRTKVMSLDMNDVMQQAIKQLRRLVSEESDVQRAIISSVAFHLCYYILSRFPASDICFPAFSPRTLIAMQLMQDSFQAPLTNSEIARQIGMSRNGFSNMFVEDTGMTPQKWYVKKRIEHACNLLRHTGYSIDEIAERTGFCDRSHFSRVFKKVRAESPGGIAQSPAQFRKS